MTLAAIQDGALQLPARDKVLFIDLLWDALCQEELAERERKWATKSEDRIDAVERGDLSTFDGAEALQNLRSSLRR